MGRQSLTEDITHKEKQMGVHLLMAGMATVLSILVILVTFVMSWEMWMIPLICIGVIVIWGFHIGRIVSNKSYEYLCSGLMMVECFFYGVHEECLYDMPVVVCILLFLLALLNKKNLLYLTGAMYLLTLVYHFLFLHTISIHMGMNNFLRLGIGVIGITGAMGLSTSMMGRRKEEARDMEEMAVLLETAKQQNADFLSNVSHELRTPINMVTGISEVALGKKLSPDLWESMSSIQLAGKRLAAQINDILDYTEITGNTLVVTNENYMPSSIINDMITMASMQDSNIDLEMIFDLDPRLPSVLVGDAEKISRAMRILIQNAIKFTEEGGIYVRMGFRKESYGVNLDITISDTGIGMTPYQLSRIYDDFYQADTGRSRYAGGLGLGIPIARGLFRAMEGFMYYDSKENQGTQVHISIPQGVADETPCMVAVNCKQLCIACYFKRDKYSCSKVRDFYDQMILHMADGLNVETYRAYHFEDLNKLMRLHKLTHIFIAQEEYEEDASYFEEIGQSVCVVLITERTYTLAKDSSMILLHKPFFALPIVNLLNGVTHGNDIGESLLDDRAFTCVDVRALVVDDEEMNLVVARGILNSYGIQIETCLSGAAAVEKCINTSYDLVFLDHMMPGMDGVETLKRIRSIRDGICENLPIIALTANAISGAREMFKGEGFTEFVPKPIERPVLERVLRKVLPERCIQYHAQEEENASCYTEPEPATEEWLTPMERLQLLGIDTQMGLDYCAGAKDFYLEMLQMYCGQAEEKRLEIVSLYENGDWAGYAVKVHALKSTSLTIGAKGLSEQAKALELAGKDGDEKYIKEHHAELIQAYEAVCQGIESAVSAADQEGETGL